MRRAGEETQEKLCHKGREISASVHNNNSLRHLDLRQEDGEELYQLLELVGHEIIYNDKHIGQVNHDRMAAPSRLPIYAPSSKISSSLTRLELDTSIGNVAERQIVRMVVYDRTRVIFTSNLQTETDEIGLYSNSEAISDVYGENVASEYTVTATSNKQVAERKFNVVLSHTQS